MPHFYLDENMPVAVASELQAFGHQATTADDLYLKRAGDDEHLWIAAQHGWILVTRDHDYRLLHDAWHRWQVTTTHAGILITPHAWTAKQTALELHALLQTSTRLTNALYEWKPGQGWVQR